jgi:cytochrome c-type biogenesis protein CcmH
MENYSRGLKAVVAGLVLATALTAVLARQSQARRGEASIPAPASPEDITLDPRVTEIARELRCPICQGLSVSDSPTDLAVQMRSLIAERLEAGESPEAIKAYFASKYGDWILLKPKREGFTWLVWLLPVVGLLLGGCVIVFFTRRSIRQAGLQEEAEPAEPDAVGHYARRLEHEIKELDS